MRCKAFALVRRLFYSSEADRDLTDERYDTGYWLVRVGILRLLSSSGAAKKIIYETAKVPESAG